MVRPLSQPARCDILWSMGIKESLRRMARKVAGTGPDWPPCPRCGGYCDLVPERDSEAPSRTECVPVELIYGHGCPERAERLRAHAAPRSEYQKRAGS